MENTFDRNCRQAGRTERTKGTFVEKMITATRTQSFQPTEKFSNLFLRFRFLLNFVTYCPALCSEKKIHVC